MIDTSETTDTTEPIAATTIVLVCDTCRFEDGEKTRGGQTGGAAFATEVERAAAAAPAVEARRFSCLMNCTRHCSAAVLATGKTAYVLGDFEATPAAAEALVAYAAAHAASESGVVPYREWPEGVKGRFISRTPWLGALDRG